MMRSYGYIITVTVNNTPNGHDDDDVGAREKKIFVLFLCPVGGEASQSLWARPNFTNPIRLPNESSNLFQILTG